MIPFITRIAISLGVSLLTLALLSRLVLSGQDPANLPRVLDILRQTVPSAILLYLGLHLLGIVLRAIRYRLLIAGAGEQPPGLGQMALVTGFRGMMVDMLPARTGELAYVALLNRSYHVGMAVCLSSLGIAVMFDFVALALIVIVAMAGFALGEGFEPWLWGALIMALLAAGIAVFGVLKVLPWVNNKLSTFQARPRSGRWLRKLSDWLSQLDQAVKLTRQSGRLGSLLSLSVAIRSLKYLSLLILFIGVAGPSFPILAETAKSKLLGAIVGAELGAALPIPALMSFGTYEAGGTLAFSLLGIEGPDALMSLLSIHIWSQFVDYSLGGLCLVLVILLTRRSQAVIGAVSSWRRTAGVALAGLVLLAGVAGAAWEFRASQKLGALSAPEIGEELHQQLAPEREHNMALLNQSGIRGFTVFSSNRLGNHDILRQSLPDGKITALTSHAHTETYPRISPDGRRIVFVRSQQPWVSQRNTVAWNLYLLDLDNGRETLIAESASYPFWIDDQTVGFLSHGLQVVQHNLDTGERSEIYSPGNGNSVPGGTPITSPDISPLTGELVFTARQSAIGLNTGFWGTAIWQNQGQGPGPIQGVMDGCELNWSADGRWLYQVGHGGRQETMFYRIDPQTLAAQPLLDLPGEFSHEYWPKDSNDGRWMVFGASRGDHEHDVADYELFLWQIGAPAGEVIRLTFHSGNDNWPDVFIEQ